MDADSGGWTLFFNYVHFPGSDLKLNSNRLPSNLKVNSHMYLDTAGFKQSDIKEIRFLCSEKAGSSDKGHYWHFKTNSEDLMHVAFTGNQKYLKVFHLFNNFSKTPFYKAILNYRNLHF